MTPRNAMLDILNRLQIHDRGALQRLIDCRVRFRLKAEDIAIPVIVGYDSTGHVTLGIMGLLNGVLSMLDPSAEPVAAVYNDNGAISEFE